MDQSELEVVAARLPTVDGEATAYSFRTSGFAESEHLALVWGDGGADAVPVVRMHSECLTGDVLGSTRCDCGWQLQRAKEMLATQEFGVLVYLRGHEGRGIGLFNKIRAYHRQSELGEDTVEANLALGLPVDERSFEPGALFLRHLGIRECDLLTNNPTKLTALTTSGVTVRKRLPLEIPTGLAPEADSYLRTKRLRLNHI